MQAATRSVDGGLILYDARLASQIHEHVFTPSYWRAREALGAPLGGRGAAWRIVADGRDWVLRFYRRGGLPGRFVQDRYFFTGIESTRPWREWKLLARLVELGLPAPQPVAARVLRTGLTYRAAIITATVPGRTLSALLAHDAMTPAAWQTTGACIRRFHDAGAWHADLNAHNVMIDGERAAAPQVHLLDFDRGRLRPQDSRWRKSNLARLQRSLRRILPPPRYDHAMNEGWPLLLAGYNGE